MARTMQFKIYRYDPDKDNAPYMQGLHLVKPGKRNLVIAPAAFHRDGNFVLVRPVKRPVVQSGESFDNVERMLTAFAEIKFDGGHCGPVSRSPALDENRPDHARSEKRHRGRLNQLARGDSHRHRARWTLMDSQHMHNRYKTMSTPDCIFFGCGPRMEALILIRRRPAAIWLRALRDAPAGRRFPRAL